MLIPLIPNHCFLTVSSFSLGLGGAAACGCGTPWAFLLPFLNVSICNHIISTKIHDKRDDFDLLIFRFCMVLSKSYGVYVSSLIHFARASSYGSDFIDQNKLLIAELLKQVYKVSQTF